MTLRECYAILELPHGACWEDVRKARKLLATVWHPDRFTASPNLRDQAEAKLKSINKAFATLKSHFDQGGTTVDSDDSAAAAGAADDVYVDRLVTYHGGDIRLKRVGFIKRHAMVRVGPEGVTLVTMAGHEPDEAVHYPAGSIQWMHVNSNAFVAREIEVDLYKWNAPYDLSDQMLRIQAADPEGLRSGFSVKLSFRNAYFCDVFQKRVRAKFCPVDLRAARRSERDRTLAEAKRREEEQQRKQAEETRRRRETEAAELQRQNGERQRQEKEEQHQIAEYRRQHPIRNLLRKLTLAMLFLLPFASVVLLVVVIPPPHLPSAPPLPPSAIRKQEAKSVSSQSEVAPDSPDVNQSLTSRFLDANDLDAGQLTYQAVQLHATGDFTGANEAYLRALRLEPDSIEVNNNLAWLRATCPNGAYRNGQEAWELARRAHDLAEKSGKLKYLHFGTLAAAYAECGDFDNAETYQRYCVRTSPAEQRAAAMKRLDMYNRKEPYRGGID